MKDRWGEYQICTGFEGSGKCWWCRGEFPDKRHRRYCSKVCSDEYYGHFYWAGASVEARKRADYKCQECGLPQHHWGREASKVIGGTLDVHHIKPLNGEPRHFNTKNQPENLIVLCRSCHGKRHRKNYSSGQSVMELKV